MRPFGRVTLVLVLLGLGLSEAHAASKAERLLDKGIAARFSPRAYRRTPVARAKLEAILLAAHSSASAFGERPWRYLVVTRRDQPDAYEKLFSTLNEKNQAWVQRRPPVLILGLSKDEYVKRTGPNPHAAHDLGMADATMALQAQALGIALRHTSGFDAVKARELFAIPPGFQVSSVMALGYPASPRVLPAERRAKEQARRARPPYANAPTLGETTFLGAWGRPLTGARE